MSEKNHGRAHIRAAADRHRTRRRRQLAYEHGYRYDSVLDLDRLRESLSKEARHFRGTSGLHHLDHIQIRRLENLLATHPDLAYAQVYIDSTLVAALGSGILRALAPYSFRMIRRLDQRLSYHRMQVEPEWTKPDITVKARSVRKRVWRRDEQVEEYLCALPDADEAPSRAVRMISRGRLYDRWAGGHLRT